jgi:EmrB/QacA subfamily drug resistance transporter
VVSPTDDDRLDPQLVRIGLVLVSGMIMSLLDTTIVNVALDKLGRELDAGLATSQWIVTGYLLALAIVIPISGWAIGRFGAKRMFMLSVALFTLGSVLCATAWSIHSLIAFRVLQGLGGGMLLPVGQTILAQTAGPKRMGRMMSLIGVPMIMGPILGPIIGGLIIDNLAWEWIFLVNLPVGIVSLALCARVLPPDERAPREPLDAVDLALLSPALALLVYGLSEAGVHGTFGEPEVWGTMAAGAVLTVAFTLYSRTRGDSALIPIAYFRDRSFAAASIVVTVIALALFGSMLLLPLYFQQVRGESAVAAGLLLAPQAVGAALAMPIAGRLTDKIGARRIVPVGVVLAVIGSLPLTQVTTTTSYWLLGIAMTVRGFGVAATMMPSIAAGYENLPISAAPHASMAINVFRQVGASIGSALLAVILVNSVTGPGPEAAAEGFQTAFWWATGFIAICFAFAFMLPRREPAQEATRQPAEQLA